MIEAYCRQLAAVLTAQLPQWQAPAMALTHQRLLTSAHGDMPRWLQALSQLPELPATLLADRDCVTVQPHKALSTIDKQQCEQALRQLMPWRKGPFELLGTYVDCEWRSDWKWQRLAAHISPLAGRTVLDVGCGSGYHGWRMLAAGAELVIGIDPTLLFFCQYLALRHYRKDAAFYFLPVRLEEMTANSNCFDTVFSMGVLYHRRSPLDHLLELFSALRAGGELLLETLVIDGDEQQVLMPEDRYAAMRNVFFLPSVPLLLRWLQRSGFVDIRVLDVSVTGVDEQRRTDWMPFHSLAEFLDPQDASRTREGYPAPQRAMLLARRP